MDIVNRDDAISSDWCKAGVDLNTISTLALNDSCPPDGQPKYCCSNPEDRAIDPKDSSTKNNPSSSDAPGPEQGRGGTFLEHSSSFN